MIQPRLINVFQKKCGYLFFPTMPEFYWGCRWLDVWRKNAEARGGCEDTRDTAGRPQVDHALERIGWNRCFQYRWPILCIAEPMPTQAGPPLCGTNQRAGRRGWTSLGCARSAAVRTRRRSDSLPL